LALLCLVGRVAARTAVTANNVFTRNNFILSKSANEGSVQKEFVNEGAGSKGHFWLRRKAYIYTQPVRSSRKEENAQSNFGASYSLLSVLIDGVEYTCRREIR
jgi:hypothetical protein